MRTFATRSEKSQSSHCSSTVGDLTQDDRSPVMPSLALKVPDVVDFGTCQLAHHPASSTAAAAAASAYGRHQVPSDACFGQSRTRRQKCLAGCTIAVPHHGRGNRAANSALALLGSGPIAGIPMGSMICFTGGAEEVLS